MKARRLNKKRVDASGRAFKGSQLQVQIYVARRSAELTGAILGELPASTAYTGVRWVAPSEEAKFKEPLDGEFLAALGF